METIIGTEHRRKIKEALTGKAKSEAHKEALKEAWKRRKARSQKTTNEQV